MSRNVRWSVLAVILGGTSVVTLPTNAAAQAGPFQYHSLTPCRLVDTRLAPGCPAGQPCGGPVLQDNQARAFPVQGRCAVPVGAKAVSVNLTAVGPNGGGFLTVYPSNLSSRPVVSNLNYSAGEPALGNGAIVPLADQASFPQDLSVFSRVAVTGGTVHVVVDVTGYFE
jgi:hypothetical protein